MLAVVNVENPKDFLFYLQINKISFPNKSVDE